MIPAVLNKIIEYVVILLFGALCGALCCKAVMGHEKVVKVEKAKVDENTCKRTEKDNAKSENGDNDTRSSTEFGLSASPPLSPSRSRSVIPGLLYLYPGTVTT